MKIKQNSVHFTKYKFVNNERRKGKPSSVKGYDAMEPPDEVDAPSHTRVLLLFFDGDTTGPL